MISEIPFTYIIIAVTGLISWTAFDRPEIKAKYMFNAYKIFHQKEYIRLLSAGFLHADIGHLVMNMFVLFAFGSDLEAAFEVVLPNGKFWFLVLYLSAIIMSSMFDLFKHKDNYYYNALGASGATSAILFAFILYYPTALFYTFIPAFIAGPIYLYYSSYMAKKGNDNIGHDAHFWGAIFGFGFAILIKPQMLLVFMSQILDFL